MFIISVKVYICQGNNLSTHLNSTQHKFKENFLPYISSATNNSYLTNYGQNVQLWTFGVTVVTFTCVIL
jgi:hypothetical protein